MASSGDNLLLTLLVFIGGAAVGILFWNMFMTRSAPAMSNPVQQFQQQQPAQSYPNQIYSKYYRNLMQTSSQPQEVIENNETMKVKRDPEGRFMGYSVDREVKVVK